MKFVQWTLAVIGSIALVVVAAGFFLPSGFSVQRSIEIEAAPRKIYDLIVEPKRWKDWSVWTRRDPDMLRILIASSKTRRRYDPGKHEPFDVEVVSC